MLLTHSLPPQFLLPSWTGPELAQAVQRSYLSGTARNGFRIRHIPLGHNSQEPAYKHATQSHKENNHLETRSHKPSRPIPVSSQAFFVGKRYGLLETNPVQGIDSEDRPHGDVSRTGRAALPKRGNLRSIKDAGKVGQTRVQQRLNRAKKQRNSAENAVVDDETTRLIEHEVQDLALQGNLHGGDRSVCEGGSMSFPRPVAPKQPASLAVPASSRPVSPEYNPIEPQSTPFTSHSRPEPLSLFEELFPEESKIKRDAVRQAEIRLERLPAFKWKVDERAHPSWEDRDEGREKQRAIPKRQDTRPIHEKTRYTSLAGEAQTQGQSTTLTERREPSVVIMDGLSKTLEESDFFRVGPKGNHIEGWTSGILRVIPARNHTTLEPLGYYYLFFSSDAAAHAYMDNTMRIHKLGRSHGGSLPFIPPVPGILKKGEDAKELLRGFSVLPRQNKLSMRLLRRPYRPHVKRLLSQGGPSAMANKGDSLVLLSVDERSVSYNDILYAIKDDGRQRNMHWKFSGQKSTDITRLGTEHTATGNIIGENSPTSHNKASRKYILSMKDTHEARRFVRDWHRRSILVAAKDHGGSGQERLAMVNAELLW